MIEVKCGLTGEWLYQMDCCLADAVMDELRNWWEETGAQVRVFICGDELLAVMSSGPAKELAGVVTVAYVCVPPSAYFVRYILDGNGSHEDTEITQESV